MIAVAPEPVAAGSELAPGYAVVRHVSRGGLFDVYEIWSAERHCRCAAKTVRRDRAEDGNARERLLREGRLLLDLAHPNIVRAYELRDGPPPVLVLEALPGMTLQYWLAQDGRLKLADVVHVGEHMCSAVAYLHERGVLHLDLKPGNLLCSFGILRVIDLSLARPPGHGHRGAGTRSYLAPEQARGDVVGPPADVWGIGLVLWEAAVGRPAFGGDRGQGSYEQLTRRAAPVAQGRRLPKAIAGGIDACLDPEPAGRPTVAELAELLERFL